MPSLHSLETLHFSFAQSSFSSAKYASKPASSSNAGSLILYSLCILNAKVGLTIISSSVTLIRNGSVNDSRSIETGTSKMGACKTACENSCSVQRIKPKARYAIFTPVSSIAERARLDRFLSAVNGLFAELYTRIWLRLSFFSYVALYSSLERVSTARGVSSSSSSVFGSYTSNTAECSARVKSVARSGQRISTVPTFVSLKLMRLLRLPVSNNRVAHLLNVCVCIAFLPYRFVNYLFIIAQPYEKGK